MPYANLSPFRVSGAEPVRSGFAVAAGAMGLITSAAVFFSAFIFSSFIPGLPWYEPCGLQGLALLVPFVALPLVGSAQRLLADRARLVGLAGPYGIFSVPVVFAALFLGGYVGTALTLLWGAYGLTLSFHVLRLVAQAQPAHSVA